MKEEADDKKIVLFDFDGVIADSFQAAFAVHKMISPHIVEDDYRGWFEGNINNWRETADPGTHRSDIDFFTEYLPKMKNEVKMVPGILEIIKNLSRSYALIIVSSTITSPIREFMEQHEAAQYFTEIMGNDVHQSKVEKMKMVFAKYKVSPEQCVFITDTLGDLKEASEAKVDAIGVSWGFQNKETLLKGNPLYIVEKPEELPTAILNSFRK
jgi:phosphoglycolate phosphatase-like HAD superfamily hydrolase